MNLSLPMCKTILDTLPVGFYTGRRIPIELDEEADTSYYSPIEDKIIVSYPIIAERMSSIAEGTCSAEEAVRSMLYHEVSHAILTPADDLNNSDKVNIFEDERIETVLKDYYHNVDFKKQLYDIHGGSVPTATDPIGAFFNAVRFGLGTPEVQHKIEVMLNRYATLNRASTRYDSEPSCADYESDIYDLYRMVAKEFARKPDAFNNPPSSGKSGKGKQKDMDKLQKCSSGKESDKEKGESETEGEGEESSENKGNEEEREGESEKAVPSHKVNTDLDTIKRMIGRSLSNGVKLSNKERDKLNEFQRTAETIISNFNKKNAGGSGINAYSGVFNPRAVARQDYRFFERSTSTRGNNKFGTCHLNLIIDCSGSFRRNEDLVNSIIATLSAIERKNRNFKLDVAFINEEIHLCTSVRERQMEATGGNDIPPETKDILRKLQEQQTCNYNIVLFDGDALSDNYSKKEKKAKLFSVFDMKQTTLITDPDNERYLNICPYSSSKVVITKEYTEELIDHIIHALTIAFG